MRDRDELRAREAVAHFLIRRLMVPRIYFEVEWPGLPRRRVDVLALDRNGVGDAHIVEIRRSARHALDSVPYLLEARSPYRWIAFFRGTEDEQSLGSLVSQTPLYRDGQAGRIGVIEIVTMAFDDLGANLRLAAERFPTPTYELARDFSRSHQAVHQFGSD